MTLDHLFARRSLGVLAIAPFLLVLSACDSRDGMSLGGGGGGDAPDGASPPATPPPSQPTTDSQDGTLSRNDVRDVTAAYAFRAASPYASVLAGCALIERETIDDACPLRTLPFVGQETATPTVDDVMDRVLVTHDWMGERFEQLLRSRQAELLPLFGSVTSVLIGSTVRPSFYWTVTGGIRLDPAGLWLSTEEKRTISIADDPRSEFRAKLAFRNFWTRQRDGDRASPFFSLEDDSERDLADIEISMMALLFHELAHANDFLPPGSRDSLDADLQPRFALDAIERDWLSPMLDTELPLNSDLLRRLAQVRFTNTEAVGDEATVSAITAGGEFAADGASFFYNYSTIREDFANQFETLMMKRLFDVDVAFAFVDQPTDPDNATCDDYIVGWGVRNRLGDPTVAARARIAYEAIYPSDPELDAFIAAQMNTEAAMTPGIDWCTNLAAGRSMAFRSRQQEMRAVEEMSGHAERHAWADSITK